MITRADELNNEQVKKLVSALGIRNDSFTENSINLTMTGIASMISQMAGSQYDKESMHETPYRVMKAFAEYTEGYAEDPSKHLLKTFDVDHQELVMVQDIKFNSLCEHHLAPFVGVAHVGYIPNDKITGLSKLARVVDGYAKRFQVQERLTGQIANAIDNVLAPKGVMVVIEAQHMCMCGRGVKKDTAFTKTSAVRGVFSEEPAARAEFLSLLYGGK